MRSSLRLVLLLSCAALCTATSGFAQTQTTQGDQVEKPFRALFGGNARDPRARQSLSLNLSLFGTYEHNGITAPNPDLLAQISPLMSQTGFYMGGVTSGEYQRNWRRSSLSANAGTTGRYYPNQGEFTRANTWGSAAFSHAFGPNTSMGASQSVGYSPYFTNGWFPAMNPVVPGQAITPGFNNYTFHRPNWQYLTGIDFLWRPTPKATVSAYYFLDYIDFKKTQLYPQATYWSSQISARFQYAITKHLSFRAGYGYVKYRHGLIFVPDLHTRQDNIELGVDYQNTIRIGKRTTFGFSTGTSMVAYQSNTYFTALVHAYIDTAMGRTWYANVTYDRNFTFVEGLQAPYATDAVAASIGGYLNRRTNLTFQAGYSHGVGVATSEGRSYGAWTGIAQLQVALARAVALFGQGYFYHFDFAGSYPYSPLPTRAWDRWGVRAGLTLWIPVLH
jgi:hypothetical protein